MEGNFKKNIVNYSLNIAILVLLGFCIYFAYSIIMNSTLSKSRGEIKDTDTTKRQTTNQPNLSIQIDILNATGENRVAAKFREYLKQKGFDVVDMGNYKSEQERTLVVDKCGDYSKAKRVADALGISQKNIIQQVDKTKFIDATVLVGKDFNDLKPFQEKIK